MCVCVCVCGGGGGGGQSMAQWTQADSRVIREGIILVISICEFVFTLCKD